jgi:hypothetical protein
MQRVPLLLHNCEAENLMLNRSVCACVCVSVWLTVRLLEDITFQSIRIYDRIYSLRHLDYFGVTNAANTYLNI